MVLGITMPLSISRNLLEILLLSVLFLLLDKPKYSWKKTIFFYVLFIIVHTIIGTIWVCVDSKSYSQLATVSIVIWSILFFWLLSQDTIYQVMYNICLQTFLLLFGVYLGVLFAQHFCNGNPWADMLFRIFYFMLVCYVYWRMLRKPYRELTDIFKIRWIELAFIALLGDILVIYCGIYPVHVMIRSFREQIIFIGICIILFVTHTVMLRMMFIMLKESKIKEELKYSTIHNAFLKKEFSEIQNSIFLSKRIKHDARHHNLIIADYAKKGDISSLLEYLNEQEQEAENNTFINYCENRTINSIFTVYAEKAQRAHIKMFIKANVGDDINIRDIDLTAILGNILDNAIQGCQKSDDTSPQINVAVHTKSGKLAIVVENTCSDDVYFEEGIPKSKCKEGVGIQSILRSVNVYHGEIDFKCENHMFLCRVLIEL